MKELTEHSFLFTHVFLKINFSEAILISLLLFSTSIRVVDTITYSLCIVHILKVGTSTAALIAPLKLPLLLLPRVSR